MPSDVRQPSRQRKACTICRALKTRCLPTPNSDPQAPCLRCAGLGEECVYTAMKRGPPKGWKRAKGTETPASRDEAGESAEESTQAGADVSAGSPTTSTLSRDLSTGSPMNQPRHQRQRRGSMGTFAKVISATYSPATSSTRSTQRPPTLPPVGAFFPNEVISTPQTRPLTLEDYFEPDVEPSAAPVAAPWLTYTDPVIVGLLSEPESRHLFRQFMDRVEPLGAIFDPQFHTYERVRSSLPLFSAVMSVAARFFQPELVEVVLDIAETNINRAMRRDDVDINLCQALLILVLWKRARDRSAYYKLGLVSRLLLQLRVAWDTEREFATIEEERAHVNIERTMSLTATTELAYSILLRLPSNHSLRVPEYEEMLVWAERHAHLRVPGDVFKAFIAEMWQYHFSPNGDLWIKSVDEWHQRLAEFRSIVDKWMESGLITGPLAGYAEALIRSRFVVTHFLGLTHGLVAASDFINVVDAYASTLRGIAASGDLQFYMEAPFAGVVMPAILLYQARTYLSPSELVNATHIVGDVRATYDKLPDSITRDHALEYVQRSYRRLHQALESWGAPNADQDKVDQDLDTFLAQLGYMMGDEGAFAASMLGVSHLDPNMLPNGVLPNSMAPT